MRRLDKIYLKPIRVALFPVETFFFFFTDDNEKSYAPNPKK